MFPESIPARLGHAADPAIELLLPKEMLAQIAVRKIDTAIRELEAAIETLKIQKGMLAKQYPAK